MKVRKKVLFGLSTSTLLLILAEGGLRLSSLDPQLTTDTLARQDAMVAYKAMHTPALQPARDRRPSDPPGGRIFTTPHQTYIEARVAMPKPAGTYRVLIVGDSVAWGLFYGEEAKTYHSPESQWEHTISGNLQRMLAALLAPRKVEVINLALPGSISEFSLARVKEGLDYELDLVVVYTGLNDQNLALLAAATDPDFRARGWLRRNLRLAELLWRALERPTHKAPKSENVTTDTANRRKATVQNLSTMIALGKARRVPVLIGLPITSHRDAVPDLRRMIRKTLPGRGGLLVDYEAHLDSVARAEGIPFQSLFSRDDVHPTARGYAEFARAIVKTLQTVGLVGSGPPGPAPAAAGGTP